MKTWISPLMIAALCALTAACGSPEKKDPLAEAAVAPPPVQDIVIEREFNAPRDRVWKAWTQPSQIKRWWGPKHFTAPVAKTDVREGGKYLFAMKGPDGKMYWSTGTYKEVARPERLVVTDSFADAKGNVVASAEYGMPGLPAELLVTTTFEELPGKKTRMVMRHAGFPAGQMADMAKAGWNESFDKLEKSLKK